MTDHVKEAQKILEHTLSYDVTDDNTTALVNIGAAQIQATLALVEQQRIANIIALNEHWEDTGSPALDAVAPALKPEIEEALGL